MNDSGHQSDPLRRARLRWRARRGLLENDLIFERFFSRYEHDLSDTDVGVLTQLLELSDNDLMDLLLARKEPDGELASPDMTRVLEMPALSLSQSRGCAIVVRIIENLFPYFD